VRAKGFEKWQRVENTDLSEFLRPVLDGSVIYVYVNIPSHESHVFPICEPGRFSPG
jgi:hypothetical protein